MPAIRTRDTPVQRPTHPTQALQVAVAEPDTTPVLNIISPTPRAFTFPMNTHTPSPSPSNSPFEPDLGPLTFSTPPPYRKTHTPSSSISSNSSLLSAASAVSTDAPATPASSHRRRRSTASDINERRPKKGDEDYIKRPENAFILFRRKCCEDRNLAQGAGEAGEGDGPAPPTKKQRQADLSKTISQQWKSLPAEERQYWEELAKEKKKEHETLYPNYVYRPQRVKGKKAAANGKGKARGTDEPETDGEAVAFVMPVPAVPQRTGRRAISAPTPPPAYQQTIHIPMVYMPSTPTTPSMVPMTIARHGTPAQVAHAGMGFDYVPPNGALLQTFNQPQGWAPEDVSCGDTYVNMFDMPQLGPLAIPSDAHTNSIFKSPTSYTASSGPPSPHMSPYTPTSIETLHIPTDAWQAQTSLPMFDSEPQMPLSLEYQPYSWANAPDLWVNGSAPLFNEDFDISMIPPISIEVPKFDDVTPVADQSCAQDYLGAHTGEQEGDTYAPVFTFNEVTELPIVNGF
ncbi:hypothetical protein BC834DRAFT_845377 [Gloeopeniophorella convolvens]|nr:hypothetical protein BC834DRAFT_845377 [Gloeopeniophorella convolvens]